MKLPFIKMNGAGNDFVVLDARQKPMLLNFEQVRAIAHRENALTKGCDQVIVLEPPPLAGGADVFMRIYNADGGEVDACGNATRCVASLMEKELGRVQVSIQTNVDVLHGVKKAAYEGKEYTLVDMGAPRLLWNEIPLAIKVDTLKVPMAGMEACCVSMGNPHAVFFMPELPSDADVTRIGSQLENNRDLFPEGVNVTFAKLPKLLDDAVAIEVKIWERGSGMTKACGTGACATLVAAVRLGLTGGRRKGHVAFSGGVLSAEWQEDGHVLLGGPLITEFAGELTL